MRIKNWEKFQNHKDRRPPWIKLWIDLLDDPDWAALTGDEAKFLVSLWMLAADWDTTHTGKLPCIRKIAFQLRMTEGAVEKLLPRLSHWLEEEIHNSTELYTTVQNSVPETETETERETDTETEAETERKALRAEFAEKFWPSYPHKVGKPDALKAFLSVRKHSSLSEILQGLAAYKAAKPPDRNWLNPATFLRQERFRDVPAPSVLPVRRVSRTREALEQIASKIREEEETNVVELSRPQICGPSSRVSGVELSATSAGTGGLSGADDYPLHGKKF